MIKTRLDRCRKENDLIHSIADKIPKAYLDGSEIRMLKDLLTYDLIQEENKINSAIKGEPQNVSY